MYNYVSFFHIKNAPCLWYGKRPAAVPIWNENNTHAYRRTTYKPKKPSHWQLEQCL